jgi:hypothetical protein
MLHFLSVDAKSHYNGASEMLLKNLEMANVKCDLVGLAIACKKKFLNNANITSIAEVGVSQT